MELIGCLLTYDWGKVGKESLVGQLYMNRKLKTLKTSETHYAELWIGTHPKAETTIRKSKENLSEYIKRHPEILGLSRYQFGNEFPFILKILSVAEPLPIRVHPNERQALILNKERPSVYTDSLHKPQMIVALTHVEVMIGVRPLPELVYFLENVPELTLVIKASLIEDYLKKKKEFYLKKVIDALLNAEKSVIREAIQKYLERMDVEDLNTRSAQLYDMVKKIQNIYPDDNGVFAPFFLNHMILSPEEAVYIPAMLPYSFLNGDFIECCPRSDNTINSGLTSDQKDIESFLDYGDFACYDPEKFRLQPTGGTYTLSYDCDEDEFIISKIKVCKDTSYSICGKRTCCVFIVIEGKGFSKKLIKIKKGTVMLVPPCGEYFMRATEDMLIYLVEPNLVI